MHQTQQTLHQQQQQKTTMATTMRTGRYSNIRNSNQDNIMGPGSYEVGNSFGSNSKGFTIGVKRQSRQEHSPGPGEYEVERSDSQTKTRVNRSIEFEKITGRRDSSPDKEGEGMITTVERFYQYPKEVPNYSIGEKRPEKPRDGPGPGEYNLDDSATKPRTVGFH